MVVSAILTTALAPITGALFGASYGTSIRIGYEIIFPALFGDVINQQKNNPTKLQEDGSKRTIEAMHKMFTGVGGASAMEFGIEQGIEMAKKKTESPDVQNMIDLNLGLTSRQLNKRGKSAQFQDPITAKETFRDVKEFIVTGDIGDFHNQTNSQIIIFFKEFTKREPFDAAFKLLQAEKGNTSFTRLIWKLRPKVASVKVAIAKSTTQGSLVQKIATQFDTLVIFLAQRRKSKDPTQKRRIRKRFLIAAAAYNRLVQGAGKSNLAVDTEKSLSAQQIIAK